MYTKIDGFEWDEKKALANLEKHGVAFEEATTAFNDPFGLVIEDEAHSKSEHRQRLIGESAGLNLIVAVFTIRFGRIRLISARPPGWKERLQYEQNRIFRL